MDAESLFTANVSVIDRVIGEVCRAARLPEDDADDFAASVRLALIENDYAVLRRWEARGTLAGYLSVVVRRLLSDRRDRERGRWRPSGAAERMGACGVLLETLVVRDGRTVDEALPLLHTHDPSLTRAAAEAMTVRFGAHARRPRVVALHEAAEESLASSERADRLVLAREARRLSRRASDVVRRTVELWPDEDAAILRFRFGSAMSVADIARTLHLRQRPLYRRIDALLAKLRAALLAIGLDTSVLLDIAGEASQEMDFGLDERKT
jgi:RNA polymerase sigma factor for flagellar operon FliA